MSERLLDILIRGQSTTAGTRLHGTKLKLDTWARGAALFAEREQRLSLRELQQACEVSHKTAWRMRDAFRDAAAIRDQQSPTQLTCVKGVQPCNRPST